MTDDELLKIAGELIELSQRKPLSRPEAQRARELMRMLKQKGYTNEQISKLTNGGWSQSTVKVYTRGVSAADTSERDRLTSQVLQMISQDITLDEVEEALSLRKHVESKGLAVDDVTSFIEWCKREKTSMKDAVRFFKDAEANNWSIQAVRESINLQKEIERFGYTLAALESLVRLTSKLGTPDNVLNAIEQYASLDQINKDIGDAKLEADRLHLEQNSLTQDRASIEREVKSLEERRAQVEEELKNCDVLLSLGFTAKVLKELVKASENYGGPAEVIAALNIHGGLKGLQKAVDETEAKLRDGEARLKTAEAEYGMLQPVMTLCHDLIYKFGYSAESVSRIHGLAKKLGNPFEVLRTMAKYRDLKELDSDAQAVRESIASEEATLRELRKKVGGLRSTEEQLTRSICRIVNSIEAAFKGYATELKSRYDESLKMWGDIKAEFGRNEKEIQLAKVISAVLLDPGVAKDFSPEYGQRLVNVTYWLCRAKDFNPKVKITEEISGKYGYAFREKEMDLLDLLKWSLKAWGGPEAG